MGSLADGRNRQSRTNECIIGNIESQRSPGSVFDFRIRCRIVDGAVIVEPDARRRRVGIQRNPAVSDIARQHIDIFFLSSVNIDGLFVLTGNIENGHRCGNIDADIPVDGRVDPRVGAGSVLFQ